MGPVQSFNAAARRLPGRAVYVAGALPALWLLGQAMAGGLGIDPVATLERSLGLWGLKFLVAGLAVTPLRRLAGVNLLKFRRALGLLGFFYVAAHLLSWIVIDMGFLWQQMLTDIVKRPYVTIGMAAFLLLLPLALTSTDAAIRRMGAGWRRLHRLVYPAVALGGLHYLLVVKAWPVEPFAYLAAILALLALRIRRRQRRSAAAAG